MKFGRPNHRAGSLTLGLGHLNLISSKAAAEEREAVKVT